ncbi:DUF3300 domain-containing protein [Alteromonadaceae bacterium BrNp21-10]|nr:DUF3300 domain-containing protein [Alteromonadaceae bacterium BrNp21-10]
MKNSAVLSRNQLVKAMLLLGVSASLSISIPVIAQQNGQDDFGQTIEQSDEQSFAQSIEEAVVLNQAELDQILAPIALYPDTLLSHILVASTYPLEVVQAARWRKNHADLDANGALSQAEDMDWDPSVIALVPFKEVLQNLSDDLSWLQKLGDAFLANEEQVLASVQDLREKAYAQGSLTNNEYIEVEREQDNIVIQTVQKEVVYVPYYDTRVVYGDWWWSAYQPYYWHQPAHYRWHNGFYWSPSFFISSGFYFGGFAWHQHHVVVNYHHRNYATHDYHRKVLRTKEYSRWQHNPKHRRSVKYDYVQPHHRQVKIVENKVRRGNEPVQIIKSRQQRFERADKFEKRILKDQRRDQQQLHNVQQKLKRQHRDGGLQKRDNQPQVVEKQQRQYDKHASLPIAEKRDLQRHLDNEVKQAPAVVQSVPSSTPNVQREQPRQLQQTREYSTVKEAPRVKVEERPQRQYEQHQYKERQVANSKPPAAVRRKVESHNRPASKQRGGRDERKHTR